MQKLEIQRTKEIPQVLLDFVTGTGSIDGECYSPEVVAMFEKISHWLRDYATFRKPFTLIINIPYYNTSTSKCLPDLFSLIEKINCNADENWAVTIVTPEQDKEEEQQEWAKMLPEFPTATFEIQ